MVNFSASEWKRVKLFTDEETILAFISGFQTFYSVTYSRSDIILLLRRFQVECRLAWSFPEVKSMMTLWLGFEFDLTVTKSKKAKHAQSFYNFIPLKIKHFS